MALSTCNKTPKEYISVILLILVVVVTESSAYRILLTTPQHGSHVLDKLALGETLAARGHEIYIAVSDKYPKLADVPKYGVKPLTFHIPSGLIIADSKEFHQIVTNNVFQGASPITTGKMASEIVNRDCTFMMEDKIFMKKVKEMKFDLVISEPFALSPCFVILPIYYNIPFVSMAGLYLPWEIRMPALPSFFSSMVPYTLDNIGKKTLIDKLKNLGIFILSTNFDLLIPGRANTTLLQKFAPQYKSWSELIRKSELFLGLNDHHLGSHAPAFPNYITVAGLTAVPAKPLPQDLEKIMQDSGEHGVIVASFGATAYYMPDHVVKIFFEAFEKLNQTVIARFGVPEGTEVPRNVKLLKWLPQTDVLGHKKTKLFITHCGNNGQYEALYHAVPMIGFPLFAEQHENSVRAEEKGISISMNILDFTADELVRNIKQVIYTDKYRDKIREMSARYHDDKFGPRDRAAFWIEHVIKYGGRHLRSPAIELSIYEFLMMDVILVLLFVFIVMIVVLFVISRKIYRRYSRKSKAEDKIKTN